MQHSVRACTDKSGNATNGKDALLRNAGYDVAHYFYSRHVGINYATIPNGIENRNTLLLILISSFVNFYILL
jgi:3-methyladenine DNA glycosylase Mpg